MTEEKRAGEDEAAALARKLARVAVEPMEGEPLSYGVAMDMAIAPVAFRMQQLLSDALRACEAKGEARGLERTAALVDALRIVMEVSSILDAADYYASWSPAEREAWDLLRDAVDPTPSGEQKE